MTNKSLKDEAVETAMETCLELDRFMNFLDMFSHLGYSMFGGPFQDDVNRKRFFDGLGMMRDSVYTRHGEAIRKLFGFSCISEGVRDYSLEKLKKTFDPSERIEVMSFLEKWGNVPSGYYDKDEKAFRKDIMEEIEKLEKK